MKDAINSAAHDLLGDPLSPVTRSTKRSLYTFTLLMMLITYTGVVSGEASILGFNFPGLTKGLIQWGLFCLSLFSYITYFVHAGSDFFRYKHKKDIYELKIAQEIDSHIVPDDAYLMAREDHMAEEFREMTGYTDYEMPIKTTKYLSEIKLLVDFWVPVVFGAVGLIYFLWDYFCN